MDRVLSGRRFRRFGPLAAVALLTCAFMAGCLDDAEEGEEGFWLVVVEGREEREPPPHYVCDVAFDHRVDEEARELRYGSWEYDVGPGEVDHAVAFGSFEGVSDCPVSYTVQFNAVQGAQEMGRYGELRFAFQDDGTVLLDDAHLLGPGDEQMFSYEDAYTDDDGQAVEVQGEFTVRHLGAWPQDSLLPE